MKLKKALALMLILWLVMPNLTGLAETEPAAVTEAEADPADLAEEGKETTDGAEVGDPDAEITADPAQDEVPEADEMSLGDADDAPDAADGAESPVGTPHGASEDAEATDDAESPVGTPHGASEDADAADAANAVTAGEEAPDAPPFEQSAVLDGVRITVRSEPGAFPAGATLSVASVPLNEQQQAEAAVDEVRAGNQNVAARYTFDIRVLDAAGDELQPAAGCAVSVSFEMAEVADENLETNVYHIADDMTAERLDVTAEDATTAVVETEGFSIYTVEFTYNTLQYVLEGGASAPLAEITTEVGLQGEPTPVCISDESLFCAAYEDGAWVIYSLRPFQTEEWMQVEIGGTTFTIAVTDSSDPVAKIGEEQYNTLEAAIGAAKVGDTVTLLEDVTLSRPLEIANDNTLTLDLNGHTIDRALTAPTAGGNVITVEGALTLTDGKGGGTITGGNNAHDGGGVVVDGGELVMNGGNITGNRTGFCGGGVFVSNVGAFTLSGGAISGNTAVASGGGVYVEDEATFALSSAPVIDGNTRDGSAPDNVYLYGDGVISVAGALSCDPIGVSTQRKPGLEDGFVTITRGLSEKGGDIGRFRSDDDDCAVGLNDAGAEAVLGGVIRHSARGYAGVCDGAGHGITVAVTEPASGYAVRYGTTAGSCELEKCPGYAEAGTYTVYYRVTANGYLPATGSAQVNITPVPAPEPERRPEIVIKGD